MKKKNKKIWIIIIVLLIVIALALYLVINKKSDKQDQNIVKIKEAIENVFYYLPENNYDDMNTISDYCKLALIYNTEYLVSDYKIYDDEQINGYTKNNVLSSVKNVLGNAAYIDFNKTEEGNYNFILADNCKFANTDIYNLTYDEQKQVVYSLSSENSNRKLFVKWLDSEENGNDIVLKAQALMAVKSDSGYDLYVDSNMEELIDNYKSLEELEKKINDNYDKSYEYEFKIKKEGNNYIWKSYKRVIDEEYIIYD